MSQTWSQHSPGVGPVLLVSAATGDEAVTLDRITPGRSIIVRRTDSSTVYRVTVAPPTGLPMDGTVDATKTVGPDSERTFYRSDAGFESIGADASVLAPAAAAPVASAATSGTLTAGAEHNLSPASAAAWTLPTGVSASAWPTTVKNNGTATLTIARGGSDTINGGTTSVTLAAGEWARFVSNGAGAWTQSGTAGQSGTYARTAGRQAGGPYATPLVVPTPDGNLNTGHPAIVRAPNGKAWNGYHYWMAHTPYPDANRENPCVVASNDGSEWEVPAGLSNPVAPLSQAIADRYLNQSDPDLEFVTIGGVVTLVMIYRAQGGTANEGLFRRTTTDGVAWTARQSVLTNTSAGTSVLLSPSICLEADGTTLSMWTVKDVGTPRPLERRRSTDGGLTWGSPTTCSYNSGGTALSMWHMDVNIVNGRYYMLITDKAGLIAWQESADGDTWIGSYKQALDKVQVPAGARGFYRASALPVFGPRQADGASSLRWDVWATITDKTGADIYSDNWRIALIPGVDMMRTGQPRLSMAATSGRYVYPLGGTMTTGSYGGGTVRYVPILVDRYCPLGVEVHIEVTVVGSAGAQGRLGLFSSAADGLPYGPALVDSLIAVDDATGDHKVTYSSAIPPGLYWGVYKAEGAPTTPATVRSVTGFVLGCPGVAAALTSTGGLVDSATVVSGALPSVPAPNSHGQSGLVHLKIL